MKPKTTALCVLGLILFCLKSGDAFVNSTLRDLPKDIRDDFVNIFNKVLTTVHDCNSSDNNQAKFLIYTKDNVQAPIQLNPKNPKEVLRNTRTVFLIHGWISNPSDFGFPKLREAYLTKGYNVIAVDWSETAFSVYTYAYCALPVIAKQVAELVCLLDSSQQVPIEMVELVGHSLGGQMSGLIGQETVRLCNKPIEKIIGMDPAGPLFFGFPTSSRLDSTDAKFVQVIHTNGGVFGYLLPCGHVDFFVNCGTVQPNCLKFDVLNLLDTTVNDVACSHLTSIDYMAESVIKDKYKGQSCRLCPKTCVADFPLSKSEVMGYGTSRSARENFLVIATEKTIYKFFK